MDCIIAFQDMKQYITKRGLEKLRKELSKLETKERRRIAEQLNEAAALGDISDNAQYQEARREQGFLEGRVADIRALIRNAIVVQEDTAKKDTIQIGSLISLDMGGEKEEFKIVGANESDPLGGMVSYQSPLGKALLGHKKGESFRFHGPAGEISVRIIKVS